MGFKTVRGAGTVLRYMDADGVPQWIEVATQRDSETGEYRARIMAPVHEKNPNADYYTDDKNDAIGTGIAMAKAIWERNNRA